MLHRVKEKKLGRDAAHRKALIKNLSTSLILNKKVETTLAKAKYVKPFFEKLITKARKDKSVNAVKFARVRLTTEEAVRTLINEVAPLLENKNGGYVRIVKLPERDGDNAKMARMELLVEKPKKETKETKSSKPAKKEKKQETEEVKTEETKEVIEEKQEEPVEEKE